jgi:catechol 2,3-dioxygenase-like lactoylglutathione lyase family enzyme
MIRHVRVEVSDLERSASFYDALFAPLGWRRHNDSGNGIGWGIHRPLFFIAEGAGVNTGSEVVCFSAAGIAGVKGAWEGGLSAGGKDDGKPARRPELGPSYYSAYLRDPDGHRIEIAISPE